MFKASDIGRTGYETVAQMNADTELKARIEQLRIACGHKMTLISAPRHGGSLNTRSFIPQVRHDAIGVLAAVTVGTACVLTGSVTEGIAVVPPGKAKTISVEHPSGEFSVPLEIDPNNPQNVLSAALLRTARLIMRGEVPAAMYGSNKCIRELEKCVKEYGNVGINLHPEHWTSPPLSHRAWHPLYEKMVEHQIPAMIHLSTSCNVCFHTTDAHYLNADTTAFMQCLTSDLFKDFPTLKFS